MAKKINPICVVHGVILHSLGAQLHHTWPFVWCGTTGSQLMDNGHTPHNYLSFFLLQTINMPDLPSHVPHHLLSSVPQPLIVHFLPVKPVTRNPCQPLPWLGVNPHQYVSLHSSGKLSAALFDRHVMAIRWSFCLWQVSLKASSSLAVYI